MGRPHHGDNDKSIDIQTVTAVDLAHYLKQGRFEGDVAAAIAFVTDVLHHVSLPLEPAGGATTGKPEKNAKECIEKLQEEADTSSGPNALGKSLLRSDASIKVTGLQPRSKFNAKFGQGGCEFVDAKRESIVLTANCVQDSHRTTTHLHHRPGAIRTDRKQRHPLQEQAIVAILLAIASDESRLGRCGNVWG
jgi:hypothetical protein